MGQGVGLASLVCQVPGEPGAASSGLTPLSPPHALRLGARCETVGEPAGVPEVLSQSVPVSHGNTCRELKPTSLKGRRQPEKAVRLARGESGKGDVMEVAEGSAGDTGRGQVEQMLRQ